MALKHAAPSGFLFWSGEEVILIFGGAYQGKLDYAMENFNVESVWDCGKEGEPDFSADVTYGLEKFVERCAATDRDAVGFFEKNRDLWVDSVLVIDDISQGVVPVDAATRKYREMNGRVMTYLAGEADQVIRVFCGIGKRIK